MGRIQMLTKYDDNDINTFPMGRVKKEMKRENQLFSLDGKIL